MGAEIALGGRMRIGIDVERIVRTRLQTHLAANAPLGIEVYDAVLLAAVERGDGTRRYAGRIIAVIAPEYGKMAAVVGKLARLNVLHPRAVNTQGHVML